jgi:hypothetical protein
MVDVVESSVNSPPSIIQPEYEPQDVQPESEPQDDAGMTNDAGNSQNTAATNDDGSMTDDVNDDTDIKTEKVFEKLFDGARCSLAEFVFYTNDWAIHNTISREAME